MANQSGIVCSSELETFLSSCRDGRVRLIKVTINEDAAPQLVLDNSLEQEAGWEEDWECMVSGQAQSDVPCFVLFRLDEKDEGENYLWVLLSWSPDSSHTRQKMLYASTKATFKKQFGASQIKDEYYANSKEEITLAGYKKHLAVEAAPGPLTRQEEEMKEIKETESRVEISVDSKHNTLSALSFPFQVEATEALEKFSNKGWDYVQLAIDLDSECVTLIDSRPLNTSELASVVPEDSAKYHVFRFKHSHESDYLESNVFVYSMPGYSVPIKERMMYSSCRNAVVEVIESNLNIKLDKKIEISSGSELTEEFLKSELHPVVSLNRPKFSKPKGPSRGQKRITKAPV